MIVIDCFIDKIWKKNNLSKIEMKKIVNECLKLTKIKAKNVFLNVSYVDSQTMRRYNRNYRKKDSDTNVLSFENKDKQLGSTLILGEMILCFEKIKAESIEFNKPFKERLYHLFVHSILHLLGYDHVKEDDRKQMEGLEGKILRKFGIYNPYLFG